MATLTDCDTVTQSRRKGRTSTPSASPQVGFSKAGMGFAIDPRMEHAWKHRTPPQTVLVDTPARLHLGFLDVSGSLGRRFGSLGLSIEGVRTRLRVRRAQQVKATGPAAERAEGFARKMLDSLNLPGGVEMAIDSAIPDHMGLGSGTQMALAVGHAVSALHGLALSTREIASRMQRGKRSGIGIGAFDRGGFLVDSGIGEDGVVPPVTARLPFPDDWRVLLIMDVRAQGLHGNHELEAFRLLGEFPREMAAHLCHLTLMQILPGVQERRFDAVAEGIAELQRLVGDHFAPAQGGRFTSREVAEALAWAEQAGHRGIGQSSWGPTGFVLLPDAETALRTLVEARRRFGELSPLRFSVTQACNCNSRVAAYTAFDDCKEMP